VVDQKSRIGDIEGDTIMGKNHQGAIVTLVDRNSRYTFARQVNFKTSDLVGQAVIDLLRPHKKRCHTITFDNGKEFVVDVNYPGRSATTILAGGSGE
jgi:IS30 family transposase